jgi:hypothetical protein
VPRMADTQSSPSPVGSLGCTPNGAGRRCAAARVAMRQLSHIKRPSTCHRVTPVALHVEHRLDRISALAARAAMAGTLAKRRPAASHVINPSDDQLALGTLYEFFRYINTAASTGSV